MGAHEMEKILVIDDNEVICDMLYDVLNEWGFCAEKAYQGMKALPLVDEFQPDLVLLDVMLPGMNGVEICRRDVYKRQKLWFNGNCGSFSCLFCIFWLSQCVLCLTYPNDNGYGVGYSKCNGRVFYHDADLRGCVLLFRACFQ